MDQSPAPVVVVTGANGLVGSRVCDALVAAGAAVRAVVRRAGTAPRHDAVVEHVGDFQDPMLARTVVQGATAVVTTVHPLDGDRQTQHRVAVEGTPALARAARDAGVGMLVHISTAAVYDRSPDVGDIDESSALVADDSDPYPVTKRDTDLALARVEGITRVLVRPPAILGPGPTSVWNTLRPQAVREEPAARRVTPDQTFAWIHVRDLADVVARLATGAVPSSSDPQQGPVPDGVTAVNLAAPRATARDYLEAVADAVGVSTEIADEPVWTGTLLTARARRWGFTPTVDLATALEELQAGLRG